MFSIVACIGKNNELGKKGDLVFHIKDDMKFFRETTSEHTVVMGLNTWNSLPSKLKKRQNLVVSYDDVDGPDGIIKDLEKYIEENHPENIKYLSTLPKTDFESLTYACDVGMIFLDNSFTIPNFPSRLLSYMQARLPVLSAADPNTDIGDVIEENGFGWKCESNDPEAFAEKVEAALKADLAAMGAKSFECLEKLYDVKHSYSIIMKGMTK